MSITLVYMKFPSVKAETLVNRFWYSRQSLNVVLLKPVYGKLFSFLGLPELFNDILALSV